MWAHAGPYMARKGIKRPGQFNPTNVHGGRLWASRKECNLTDKMAGEILERVYESGKVCLDQLKQVRHSMSYAWYLTTGESGWNYPEVKAQWHSFNLKTLPKSTRPLKPTRIPTPMNLKKAFTTPWKPNSGTSLTNHMLGVLTAHDTHIFGLRPNVDVKKVKDSTTHFINVNEGYGWTEMVGGRSKLHGHKRGTRPWKVFRICFCKAGKHTPVTRLKLDKEGNPDREPPWNTCCPLAAMEFLSSKQGKNWRVYAKWTKRKVYGGQNVGDVATHANEWLKQQGVSGYPFDRNSGRKSLSRWLDYLGIVYEEHLPIHGDLEQVWRNHYQKALLKSGYRVRKQPNDPDTCTRALRRFAKWLHRGDEDPKKPMDKKERMLTWILSKLGGKVEDFE